MNSLASWYDRCVARRWVRSPRCWRRVVPLVAVAFLIGLSLGEFYMPAQASAPRHSTSERMPSPLGVIFNRPINFPLDAVPLPDHPSSMVPGPGLYGGTLDISTCDAGAILAFLQANGDKAAAWARVQGIDVADIPGYIAKLKPVILRSRLVVNSHGFSNGQPTDEPKILPTGTAILVDKTGTPRALCYCGNPLTVDITVKAFLDRCADSSLRFLGQFNWPGELGPVKINESTNYLAAVDIESQQQTPTQLQIPGPTPNSTKVQVTCVLNARLMPPQDESLAIDGKTTVDEKDWLSRQFDLGGVVDWTWSVTGLKPGDHALTLQVRPALQLGKNGPTQGDDSRIVSKETTVHVLPGGVVYSIGYWYDHDYPILKKVGSGVGMSLLAILAFSRKLREAVTALFKKKEQTGATGSHPEP
jgi:hypothetical protein